MEEKKEHHKEHEEHSEHSEHTEHKEHAEHSEHKKRNDWKMFSAILGVVIILLLVFIFYRGVGAGGGVSSTIAGEKVIAFATAQGIDAKVVNVSKQNGLYEVVLLMQGKEVPVYVTSDGKNLIPSLIPLESDNSNSNTPDQQQNQPPQDLVKSDKPKVEAYIFSYCPYGLQFEKALFPVYDLLKSKADINIVAIGAMHGEYEKIESYRQLCVEKLYGRDKLFKYLKAFDENTAISSCSGTATCVDPLVAKIYTSLAIVKSNVDSCMAKDAQALYNAQGAKANGLGIGGSPTFVINGVQVQVDRTPESIKQAVCNAFTTAPSECSQTLSTASASPGFGASTGASASANSAAGCAPA